MSLANGSRKLGRVQVGDRVVTPTGRIARVEAVRNIEGDVCTRLLLLYIDAPAIGSQPYLDRFRVLLPKRICSPYEGPPVVFADERRMAQIKIERALRNEQAGRS